MIDPARGGAMLRPMLRLSKEPLVHFLLLGAAVFGLFRLTREPVEAAPRDEIVVTAAQVRQLAAVFQKTWQRSPTPSELDTLVESRIREEVFYREALAAGLDKDDTIVRRRMKQKLEFLMEDIAGQVTPTEADLRGFLEAHPDRFRFEPTFSFRQVYLSDDRRRNVAQDARELLARLKLAGADADTASLGDRLIMVEPAFERAPQRDVARVFGDDFAARLVELPTGEWTGPIRSGYGLHLVFVEARTKGEVARLDDVRDAVAREWGVAKRLEMRDQVYQELRGRYAITVEKK